MHLVQLHIQNINSLGWTQAETSNLPAVNTEIGLPILAPNVLYRGLAHLGTGTDYSDKYWSYSRGGALFRNACLESGANLFF